MNSPVDSKKLFPYWLGQFFYFILFYFIFFGGGGGGGGEVGELADFDYILLNMSNV